MIFISIFFLLRQRLHLYVFVARKKEKSHVLPQSIKLPKSSFVATKMRLAAHISAFEQE